LLGQLLFLGFHLFKSHLKELVLLLNAHLLPFELLDLLTLALSRRLSGRAISKNALDPTLFLLIFGLCTLSKIT